MAGEFTETEIGNEMIRSVPLSVPVTAGEELITRTRYADPDGIAQGIVALMVPVSAVEVSVPIAVGAAKLPNASDNCAVYTFPAVKVPVAVKGTFIEPQAQKGLPAIAPVVIVLLAVTAVRVMSSTANEGSLPAELLFLQRKPIFTLGFPSQTAGKVPV
jgi:hypothetical protein